MKSAWMVLLACGAVAGLGCGGGSGGGGGESDDDVDRTSTGGEASPAATDEQPERPLAAMGWQPDAHGVRPQSAAAPHPDLREVYATIAPSVVIIRTEHGMGTGIIVGEDGLILTNNHVVADAATEDFEMKVLVELGAINENGAMAIEGEGHEARVVKVNPEKDLALIRLTDPPDELPPVVPLAEELPTPGESVTCLGHGNVGLLWSIRSCEVTATGRMEESYARLHAVCASEEEMAQMMCHQMRDHFHRRTNGLVVQSSCVITPGDSGGPLIDDTGKLVGVNVFTMRNEMGQTSSFHVHLREVRDFMEEIPDETLRALPTPWLAAPAEVAAQDFDFDGTIDAIVMIGGHHEAAKLIDLDQDSADFASSDIDNVMRDRRFDAEVGILSRQDGNYVWYDTDDDGNLDLLLSVSHRSVETAHRVAPDGSVTEAPDQVSGPPQRPDLFGGEARARYDRIFDGLEETHSNPGAVPGILRAGRLQDTDRDGEFDLLRADRIFAHAAVFDVDQNTLGQAEQDGVEELVRGGDIDIEVSLIRSGSAAWAYYDRDDDGQMDAGFRTAHNSPVVAEVLTIEGAEPLDPNDYVGTLALHPHLLQDGSDRFLRMVRSLVPPNWVAQRDESDGLPDPLHHHFLPHVREQEVEARGWDHAVAVVNSRGFTSILIDVNRDSFRGRNRSHLDDGIEAAVRGGHFSAELGYIATDQAAWAWYDTDHDGTWDIVLCRVDDHGETRHNAFRRGDDGWAHDEELVEGKLVRPSLLRRNQRRRFGRLAREVFTSDVVEER